MAPRKKVEEKASTNEAADIILTYLRKQNRPYSATDISANLYNKVTKASTAKILKDLHEQKQIEGRPAGKQIVYHALQSPQDSCTQEQLAALDTSITDLRTQTTNLHTAAKSLRSTLTSINSTLSTADLITEVQQLETEKIDVVMRLDSLKAGKAEKVTKKQMEDVERDRKKWIGVAKRREVISKEVWKVIESVVSEKEQRLELREALGLDE